MSLLVYCELGYQYSGLLISTYFLTSFTGHLSKYTQKRSCLPSMICYKIIYYNVLVIQCNILPVSHCLFPYGVILQSCAKLTETKLVS